MEKLIKCPLCGYERLVVIINGKPRYTLCNSCAHKRPLASPEERFWKHVEKTNTCWIWTAAKDKISNYGKFALTSTNIIYAHSYSYKLAYGEYDHNLYVCHKCDNPPCVNPDHLFLGTQHDNMIDALNKGKIDRHGDLAGRRTLSEIDAIDIKKRYNKGCGETIDNIFNDYKNRVSRFTIYSICSNITWKYIDIDKLNNACAIEIVK